MIIPPAERLQQVQEYYFSRKLAEIRQMMAEGKEVINLGIGNPDGMPPARVIEVLKETTSRTYVHGYQSYAGIPELKIAIAEFLQWAFACELNAEKEILPLIGSKEGITHISLAFLNPGDQVLVPELAYPAYAAVAKMVGAEVVYYPLLEEEQYAPDWHFLEQLDTSRVKLMWLNYPHMPTGTRATKALFQRFISYSEKHSILLCHDNPYAMILPGGQPLSLLNEKGGREVALELNSMSKSFNMAGWRIGWVAGKEDYLKTILQVKSNVDSGMFKSVMLAAVEALKSRKEWFEELNSQYRDRRRTLHNLLDILACSYAENQQGLFIWAKIPDDYANAEAFVDHWLQEKHVFMAPGSIFGEKGAQYVRVSLCVKEEIIQKAIHRMS